MADMFAPLVAQLKANPMTTFSTPSASSLLAASRMRGSLPSVKTIVLDFLPGVLE